MALDRGWRAPAGMVLLLLAALPTGAAQISPGPLSEAHAGLEGMTNCLQCHGIGENIVASKCLECHQEITWLRDAGRGLHGLEIGDCQSCHKEHGGREFEVIHWETGGPEAFDHVRSGYVLDGAHASAECRACHQPKYHQGPVPALVEDGLAETSWLGMETSCVSCHDDVHAGSLGTSCQECHTTNNFKEIVETFNHDVTRYPLRGGHVDVKCESCHRNGYDKNALPAFARCLDCHADPHRGEATLAGSAVDCERCHVVDHFRPSTFTVSLHQKTKYPLEGAHARVRCEDCHGRGSARNAAGELRASFRFRVEAGKCVSCHEDPHGRQLAARTDGGSCESCHGLSAFTPSQYTVADHRDSDFPLEGRHAEVNCRSCHGPDRPLLPAVAPVSVTGPARVQFAFDSQECVVCHRDPHEGRFAAGTERGGADGCVTCHGVNSFGTTRVDAEAHARYAFPLDGAHAAVPCFDCHKDLQRPPASTLLLASAGHLSFASDAKKCVDCHQDPHGGQFSARLDGGACNACHDSGAFTPASLFDHDRDARFPLEGAHQKVACEKCHFLGARADGTEGPIYRPIVPHRCEDCHGPSTPALEGLGP